jgi:hypothetical protein
VGLLTMMKVVLKERNVPMISTQLTIVRGVGGLFKKTAPREWILSLYSYLVLAWIVYCKTQTCLRLKVQKFWLKEMLCDLAPAFQK